MSRHTFPSLPVSGARKSPETEGMRAEFYDRQYGTVEAYLYDSDGSLADIIHARSFEEAWHEVARLYPRAAWSPDEDDTDDTDSADD